MSLKSFIVNLQNSDSPRKLRWLIGLTAITTVLIVGGWLTFISVDTSPQGLVRKENEPTIIKTIAEGTKHIVSVLRVKTANTINYFSHKIKRSNTIEVDVQDQQTQ